jgi:hypothetical protein
MKMSKTFRPTACMTGSALLVFMAAASTPALGPADFSLHYIDNGAERSYGIGFGDVNGDRYPDIAMGGFIYLNPRGDIAGKWQKVALPTQVGDAQLMVDADGDGKCEVISFAGAVIYWIRPTNAEATTFAVTPIANNHPQDYGSCEGSYWVDVVKGGKPELVCSGGNDDINMYKVPDNPAGAAWPSVKVGALAGDEGLGFGDIDGDGETDIVGGPEGGPAKWFKNKGDGSGGWPGYNVGTVTRKVDRPAACDIDGDKDIDIFVVSTNGEVCWFENTGKPTGAWPKHAMGSTGGNGHSGDAADLDGDGDVDGLSGSTTVKVCKVWVNDGKGNFTSFSLPGSADQHNGARFVDLDLDGDLDIVGQGWFDMSLRFWMNHTDKPVAIDPRSYIRGHPATGGSPSGPGRWLSPYAGGERSALGRVYDARGRIVVGAGRAATREFASLAHIVVAPAGERVGARLGTLVE